MSLTLWDVMLPRRREKPDRPAPRADARPTQPSKPRPAAQPKPAPKPAGAQARYDLMTRTMLARSGVRVRKWRTAMSGVAWQVTYRDGAVSKLIEAPRPKGPMSAAVFLHEIGHHAIGFSTYSPRCLEEYHAWRYALEQMHAWELNVTQRVHDRVHDSLHYAVQKARRRGLKQLPPELEPYARPRPGRQSCRSSNTTSGEPTAQP